jgi:hypothetical protein
MLSRSIKIATNEGETCQPGLALNSTFVAPCEFLVSLSRLAIIAELEQRVAEDGEAGRFLWRHFDETPGAVARRTELMRGQLHAPQGPETGGVHLRRHGIYRSFRRTPRLREPFIFTRVAQQIEVTRCEQVLRGEIARIIFYPILQKTERAVGAKRARTQRQRNEDQDQKTHKKNRADRVSDRRGQRNKELFSYAYYRRSCPAQTAAAIARGMEMYL